MNYSNYIDYEINYISSKNVKANIDCHILVPVKTAIHFHQTLITPYQAESRAEKLLHLFYTNGGCYDSISTGHASVVQSYIDPLNEQAGVHQFDYYTDNILTRRTLMRQFFDKSLVRYKLDQEQQKESKPPSVFMTELSFLNASGRFLKPARLIFDSNNELVNICNKVLTNSRTARRQDQNLLKAQLRDGHGMHGLPDDAFVAMNKPSDMLHKLIISPETPGF